jgi:hypothetical protein
LNIFGDDEQPRNTLIFTRLRNAQDAKRLLLEDDGLQGISDIKLSLVPADGSALDEFYLQLEQDA